MRSFRNCSPYLMVSSVRRSAWIRASCQRSRPSLFDAVNSSDRWSMSILLAGLATLQRTPFRAN